MDGWKVSFRKRISAGERLGLIMLGSGSVCVCVYSYLYIYIYMCVYLYICIDIFPLVSHQMSSQILVSIDSMFFISSFNFLLKMETLS